MSLCPADSNDCQALNFGHGSVVCACNATNCDSVGRVVLPDPGQFVSYVSSKTGSRLVRSQGQFQENSTGAGECSYSHHEIKLDNSKYYSTYY